MRAWELHEAGWKQHEIAKAFGSFCQLAGQLGPLLFTQLGNRSWRRLMFQGIDSLFSRLFEPLTHCSLTHSQCFGYLMLLPSCFMQFPSSHPSSFAPILWRGCFFLHTSFYRPFGPSLYFSLLRSIKCNY